MPAFLAEQHVAPYLLIRLLGLVLVVNGLHLLWASSLASFSKYWLVYFAVGDGLWAIATLGVILSGLWLTTFAGIAVFVAVMGGVLLRAIASL